MKSSSRRTWNAERPAGASDTTRAAELLAARLPDPLEVFARLAYDFACFWTSEGRSLFASVDPHTWERTGRNPVRLLDETGFPRERYEFQMLLGVAERMRDQLVAKGHPLRVYVPFGEAWLAYSLRRLRENPQIAGHVMRNLFRRR